MMILKALITVSLVNLMACAGVNFEIAYQEPEVAGIVQEFESTYKVDIRDIEIKFVDKLQNTVVGLCHRKSDVRKIQLLRSAWNDFSPWSKKSLIFHELGHCKFDREHREETYVDGCPASIMASFLLTDACLIRHEQDLLNELPLQL